MFLDRKNVSLLKDNTDKNFDSARKNIFLLKKQTNKRLQSYLKRSE